MNKEIKFRVWNKELKRMLDYNDIYSVITLGGEIFTLNITNSSETVLSYDRIDKSDNLILMQFTGLLDKNGIEIYEGDIGKFVFYPAEIEQGTQTAIEEVIFKDGQFGIKKANSIIGFSAIMNTEKDFEVIGNVCENPELWGA